MVMRAYTIAQQAAAQDVRVKPLLDWDYVALAKDAVWFAEIYAPISILPPDQYGSLVVQGTTGCSYNACLFCDFYRDRRFTVKRAGEFVAHLAAVRAFFGPALPLRRSIFLADANAAVAPMPRLREWFDALEASGLLEGRGVYSFVDVFTPERKSHDEWRELVGRGLRRAYLGFETGDDELRRWLRKPGATGEAVAAVRALKAAGVAVSVIVITGLGGDRFAPQHAAHTADALHRMELGGRDILYFLPLVADAASGYAEAAAGAGIRSLPAEAILAQEQAIREAVRSSIQRGLICSRYDIREFAYS